MPKRTEKAGKKAQPKGTEKIGQKTKKARKEPSEGKQASDIRQLAGQRIAKGGFPPMVVE